MLSSHSHEFHFIINKSMKERLTRLDMYEKAGNLSGIIVKILSMLSPILKKKHKWGKQRKSRYLPISSHPEEIREHVHAYFPENVYRELKLMHQDLNYYSIAQLIREFLRLFLYLAKKIGNNVNNVFQGLKRLYRRWDEEDKKLKLSPRKIVRQLWIIIQHFYGHNRIINIYNQQYSPSWVFLL